MRLADVKIGGIYMAKVGTRQIPVRIDSGNEYGGWNATNTQTGRPVRIKTPQRLRKKVPLREDFDAKVRETREALWS